MSYGRNGSFTKDLLHAPRWGVLRDRTHVLTAFDQIILENTQTDELTFMAFSTDQ